MLDQLRKQPLYVLDRELAVAVEQHLEELGQMGLEREVLHELADGAVLGVSDQGGHVRV